MMIREMKVVYKTKKPTKELTLINSPKTVWKFTLSVLGGATQESFLVISLNNRNQVHGFYIAAIGTANEALIHPRAVFKSAILVNATGVILVHNHPSGCLEVSSADRLTTARLVDAGKLLGITILDHVIVTDGGFLSMKEDGYF